MKLYNGSIQRKRLWYYLVLSFHGRQRWIALKTTNLATARARAARLAPYTNDQTLFLHHLVHVGEEARRALYQGPRGTSAAEKPNSLVKLRLGKVNLHIAEKMV